MKKQTLTERVEFLEGFIPENVPFVRADVITGYENRIKALEEDSHEADYVFNREGISLIATEVYFTQRHKRRKARAQHIGEWVERLCLVGLGAGVAGLARVMFQ